MEITKEEYPKPRRKSGLGKSIKVLEIGEVIQFFTEREKLCK